MSGWMRWPTPAEAQPELKPRKIGDQDFWQDDWISPSDLDARLETMAEEYEWGGDENVTITERERMLLIDFAHGVMADEILVAMLRAHHDPNARGRPDSPPSAEAQAQGGWDLKEVVCLACGDHIMPMGQVCHACSHPVSAPPSAPVGVEAMPGLRRELSVIARRDDAGMVSIEPNEAAAILRALAQKPAAVDESRAMKLWDEFREAGNHEHDALTFVLRALAAQPGGSDNDH